MLLGGPFPSSVRAPTLPAPPDANSSLAGGNIVVDDIDTVLKRLFRVRIRLGFFNPPSGLQTCVLR